MEPWNLWRELARESERVARLAEADSSFRSAASRYHYAAYQSVTALLLYRGLTPPMAMEAWSHILTPILLKEETGALIVSRDRRRDLSIRLKRLYDLRIVADYIASGAVTSELLDTSRRDAGLILAVVDGILL